MRLWHAQGCHWDSPVGAQGLQRLGFCQAQTLNKPLGSLTSAPRGQGGILAIDTAPGGDDLVATAGADGSVVLFDRAAGRVRSQLAAHAKRVTGACSAAPCCRRRMLQAMTPHGLWSTQAARACGCQSRARVYRHQG